MSLLASEMNQIQIEVASIDFEDLERIHSEMIEELRGVGMIAKSKPLSSYEIKATHMLVEHIVRLECRLTGGGSFTRWRRRMSLMSKALNGRLPLTAKAA